jgi:DNA-binding transcriptional LysR family regulator
VLSRQPLVAAVAAADPLAARTTISVRALARHPLICIPEGSGLRAALDEACRAAGVRPRVAFEAGDPTTLAQLAAHGLGVAVLPASAAHAVGGLHRLAITGPTPQGRVDLVWRAPSPAGRALLERINLTFT